MDMRPKETVCVTSHACLGKFTKRSFGLIHLIVALKFYILQDLQQGLDLGLVSPEMLQNFFDLEQYPFISELTHRFQVSILPSIEKNRVFFNQLHLSPTNSPFLFSSVYKIMEKLFDAGF